MIYFNFKMTTKDKQREQIVFSLRFLWLRDVVGQYDHFFDNDQFRVFRVVLFGQHVSYY